MILGLMGLPNSGKDEAARILGRELGFKRVAFADALRECLYGLDPFITAYDEDGREYRVPFSVHVDRVGWDKAKRDSKEVRGLLQRMGTEVGRDHFGKDCWVNIVRRKIGDASGNWVITDVRFENEVDMVRSYPGGKILAIESIRSDKPTGHVSDSMNPRNYADDVIENNGTLEDYAAKLLAYVGALV